jgi:hypothetical protein
VEWRERTFKLVDNGKMEPGRGNRPVAPTQLGQGSTLRADLKQKN